VSASKLKNQIGVILLEKPMSLTEVAEAMGVKEKKAYNLLKSMFQDDRIAGFKDTDGVRRYRVTDEEAEDAAKRKARAEKKEAK
jgi:DNA-binding IclR family transcriptional regulator